MRYPTKWVAIVAALSLLWTLGEWAYRLWWTTRLFSEFRRTEWDAPREKVG